ncbi:ankyrin, partial [Peniophora sp. CONT]
LRCHARDKDGQTALHEAAYMGHCVIGRLLLKHGAPIDDADGHGKTPLHCATSSGDLDTVRLLLKHPAVDGSDAAALRCCARDKDGWTALHEAAYRGNTEICRLLL